MDILPRVDEVVIPIEKFTEHSLNKEKQPDKAEAFRRALGYEIHNAQHLIENIRLNIKNFPAISRGHTQYGREYHILMRLKGPNGKTAKVKVCWIDEYDTGEMRLVTAFVDK
jgi:SPX domain protein involved in polyphosphate accumulation